MKFKKKRFWGAFSHSAGTVPIVISFIPGTPLNTTRLQTHASSIQNSLGGADFRTLGPVATGGGKQPTFGTAHGPSKTTICCNATLESCLQKRTQTHLLIGILMVSSVVQMSHLPPPPPPPPGPAPTDNSAQISGFPAFSLAIFKRAQVSKCDLLELMHRARLAQVPNL